MKRLLVISALSFSATMWAEVEPIHFDAPPPPQAPAPATSAATSAPAAAAGHDKKPVRPHSRHHHAKKTPAPKQGT